MDDIARHTDFDRTAVRPFQFSSSKPLYPAWCFDPDIRGYLCVGAGCKSSRTIASCHQCHAAVSL